MKTDRFISELDTQRFGFNVAKVNEFDTVPENLLGLLKENHVKLVISKINANNLELINKLESLDFQIKDIQATYKLELKNFILNERLEKNNITIRDAQMGDVDQLEEIAIESFRNYGHYYADKKLDPQKSNEIYGDWIQRSMKEDGVADKIILAEINNEIAGFLSFKLHNKDDYKYAAGGLGAVSCKFRNRKIFRLISLAGLFWGKEIKLDWEEHNVLITNTPIIRIFSRLGFTISDSFVTMHHWIE
jgi:hypothetical protein